MSARFHYAKNFRPRFRTKGDIATVPFFSHETFLIASVRRIHLGGILKRSLFRGRQMIGRIGDDTINAIRL
jgi:hypothetical protein